MKYTTDDMRNWAGEIDRFDMDFGGVPLAMREAADEIDRLRTALEMIAHASPGGMPGPRVFATDVLAGNVVIVPYVKSHDPTEPL